MIGFFVRLVYIPALVVLGFWIVVQFFSGFLTLGLATGGEPGGGVAFWAHVGGFVAGMLLLFVFRPRGDSAASVVSRAGQVFRYTERAPQRPARSRPRPSKREETAHEGRHHGRRIRDPTASPHRPTSPSRSCRSATFRSWSTPCGLLKRHGFTDLLVLLYFLPETITTHFGDGSRWGVRISYTTPTADLGTAGAVRFAAGELGEPVLVISGDVLTDFDLEAAVRSHRDRRAEATIVLTRVDSPLAYGIVITDEAGRIVRFLEKPSWGEVFSDTINTGIYILEPSVLDAVPAGRPYDFGKELFPALLAAGRPLYGHVAEGYWRDVGDLTEYRTAHLDLLQGRVDVEIPGTRAAGSGPQRLGGRGRPRGLPRASSRAR